MNSILIFLGFIVGIVVLGRVVALVNGTKTQFVETFALESGERVLWEDLKSDAFTLAKARARWTTFTPYRRSAVRVTSLRIVSGQKSAFGTRHVVQQVLYPSDRPYPERANDITGGFFKYGYKVLVFDRLLAQMQARLGRARRARRALGGSSRGLGAALGQCG